MKTVCLGVLILGLQFVRVQLVGPCPVRTYPYVLSESLSQMFLQINHDVKPLPVSKIRIIITIATDELDKIRAGLLHGFVAPNVYDGTYVWLYPSVTPDPKVTEVILNGDVICSGPGDKPTPTQDVAQVTFQAMWEGNGGLQGNNYQKTFDAILKSYQSKATTPQTILLPPQNDAAYSSGKIEEAQSTEDACSSSPCGVNTKCRAFNELALCTCLSGYLGNPITGCRECDSHNECGDQQLGQDLKCSSCEACPDVCRGPPSAEDYIREGGTDGKRIFRECTFDSDCPRYKPACVNNSCIDPCINACGTNAECRTSGTSQGAAAPEPICYCPIYMTGDPSTCCRPLETLELHLEPPPVMHHLPTSLKPITTAITTTHQIYSEPVTMAPSPGLLISNTPTTMDECGVVAGGNQIYRLIHSGLSFERGQIPWLAAIFKIRKRTSLIFTCGGTLVSDRHVVTAAHCMQSPLTLTKLRDIVVKLGVYDLNDWSDDIAVTRTLIKATIHETYNAETLQNDILILTLNKRVQFNMYIRPACLWSGNTDLTLVVGATGIVAGWGDQGKKDEDELDEPKMVRVPIVSTKDCRASKSVFHSLTHNNTLCAGDRTGAGPCAGDSGGGLYLLDSGKWRLRGVVSVSLQNEARSCDLNEYIVYTDTAQFLPWIRNILSEKYYD